MQPVRNIFQYQLKKPDAVNFNRKNDVLPFENIVPIEGFCKKHTASMFTFTSHNKKRPNNLILGKYELNLY